MKIAIPLADNNGENSKISEHFGHAPYFAIVEVHDNEEIELEIIENPLLEHGPGELPEFLKSQQVEIIIVRGIGKRAISFFENFGVKVIRGAEGTVKNILYSFLHGKLEDKEYTVKDKLHKH